MGAKFGGGGGGWICPFLAWEVLIFAGESCLWTPEKSVGHKKRLQDAQGVKAKPEKQYHTHFT